MKSRMLIHGAAHRGLLALAVVAFGVMAGLAGTSAAAADTSSSGGASKAAVVTPLFEMFEFGDTVGLPLACSDGGSVISIVGAQSGASKALSPLVVELDTQCNRLSTKGEGYLQQAIAESQALALVNPMVDPLIAALSSALTTVGTQYGPSISPFGPTVAGLGGTVAFFEGT